MDYRKFYEKQTNVKLPKNFDVHHIDLNRKNNSIVNLIAIPKKTHKKYHMLLGHIGNTLDLELLLKPSHLPTNLGTNNF